MLLLFVTMDLNKGPPERVVGLLSRKRKLGSCAPVNQPADTCVLRGNSDCAANTDDQLVIPTPDMEFGLQSMTMEDVKKAAVSQVRLHRVHAPAALVHAQGLHGINLERYNNYRLAAVSWFAYIVPLCTSADVHTVVSATLDLLDRHVVTSLQNGIELQDLLREIRSTRAACLMLSCHMHCVFRTVGLQHVCLAYRWPVKAVTADPNCDEDDEQCTTVDGVRRKLQEITVTLKGSLFPTHTETAISVFCKYMLLEHVGETANRDAFATEPRIRSLAMKLYARRALTVELLKYKPVRCMAACCLMAMTKTLDIAPVNAKTLRLTVIDLLLDMNCQGVSEQELNDMASLLAPEDCVVCTGPFVTTACAERALRTLSASSCCGCKELVG